MSMLTQLCTASCKEHEGCGSKSYMGQKWSFARYAKGEGNMGHANMRVVDLRCLVTKFMHVSIK